MIFFSTLRDRSERLGPSRSRSRSTTAGVIRGLAVIILLAACSPPPASEPADSAPVSDPAIRIADQVMEALGGQAAWDRTRHIRFTFFGRRTHHWDKWTGNHRMEGNTTEGLHFVVLENIQNRDGKVFLDGKQLERDEAAQWLERGYRSWVNDTYWLVMPYKLRDPGVRLSHEGVEEIEGRSYEVLHLSFDSVGLTPGDQYWAYINQDTGLMDRWAYLLQSMERDAQPTSWKWSGWRQFGEIMLAPRRIRVSDGFEAELGDIAVFDQLPDAVYTSPEAIP